MQSLDQSLGDFFEQKLIYKNKFGLEFCYYEQGSIVVAADMVGWESGLDDFTLEISCTFKSISDLILHLSISSVLNLNDITPERLGQLVEKGIASVIYYREKPQLRILSFQKTKGCVLVTDIVTGDSAVHELQLKTPSDYIDFARQFFSGSDQQ